MLRKWDSDKKTNLYIYIDILWFQYKICQKRSAYYMGAEIQIKKLT